MRSRPSTLPAFTALAVLCSLGATSCIVSEPKKLEEQERIPPRVLYDFIEPSPTTITQMRHEPGASPPFFSVHFVSDDLLEDVEGRLFLNFGLTSQKKIGELTMSESTIDNLDRYMAIPWDRATTEPAGCYVVTMTIAHETNYPPGGDLEGPSNEEEAAFISWVIAYGEGPEFFGVDECPEPGEIATN